MTELFKSTVAYKIISGDKKRGHLSHAYSLVCEDGAALNRFLKVMAKLIVCNDEEFCDQCRSCRLINKNTHSDVTLYPREEGGRIAVADVDELIAQTYVKPIEGEKRVFVLTKTSNMLAAAQNKLLKTLEEPPKNVHILIGVENENALLPTVKSRVKRLEIPKFSDAQLIEGLKAECPDYEKLKKAVALSNGMVGKALEYYNSEYSDETADLVLSVLKNMKTSREVSTFSSKIDKGNIREFLICLKKTMSEIIRYHARGEGEGFIAELSSVYKSGAAIAIIEKVNQAERSLFFSANVTMLADNVLLCILEETYRWKKL